MSRISKNLYTPTKKGYYIYCKRDGRFLAQRNFDSGIRRASLHYTLEEAIDWINNIY